jgi:hypothetical protein
MYSTFMNIYLVSVTRLTANAFECGQAMMVATLVIIHMALQAIKYRFSVLCSFAQVNSKCICMRNNQGSSASGISCAEILPGFFKPLCIS